MQIGEKMKEKYALITGASRGIGKSIATALAEHGYHLVLICKNSSFELDCLKQNLEKNYSISCKNYIGDVGNYPFIEKVFSEISSLDVLINNAGISHIGLLSDMTKDEWDHILSTNLTSVFNCCKFATKRMVHQKSGKIINISSVWGCTGASMEVAYSATKGGINAFTKALAKELAPSNIQVNALACGVIDTEMNNCFSEEERILLQEEIPAGYFASPKDVSEMVLSLVNCNSYLTGQVISFDGGFI